MMNHFRPKRHPGAQHKRAQQLGYEEAANYHAPQGI